MDRETENLLYVYKRALHMLSSVTEKEVKEHLNCTYEEYVQGVAKKHLELGESFETKQKLKNKEEESMKASFFKGKDVILFYKENENPDVENPVVTILDELDGFGLYVEFEGGQREVVSYSEISGWRELDDKNKGSSD